MRSSYCSQSGRTRESSSDSLVLQGHGAPPRARLGASAHEQSVFTAQLSTRPESSSFILGERMGLFNSFACPPGTQPQLSPSICQEQPITFQANVVPRQPKLLPQKQAPDRKKHGDGGRRVNGERTAQSPRTWMSHCPQSLSQHPGPRCLLHNRQAPHLGAPTERDSMTP